MKKQSIQSDQSIPFDQSCYPSDREIIAGLVSELAADCVGRVE